MLTAGSIYVNGVATVDDQVELNEVIREADAAHPGSFKIQFAKTSGGGGLTIAEDHDPNSSGGDSYALEPRPRRQSDHRRPRRNAGRRKRESCCSSMQAT